MVAPGFDSPESTKTFRQNLIYLDNITEFKIITMRQGLQKYIDDAIECKIEAKIFTEECNVKFYFENRHKGLAGISNEMVVDQCFASIRRLRVWLELDKRNEFFKMINR